MIRLFGRDEYSVLGIASILDIEKIPYRRLARLDGGAGDLLLVTAADLSTAEMAALGGQPAIVLNGGPRFARHVFGARHPHSHCGACSIALDSPLWPAALTRSAERFGKSVLRIPAAPMCRTVGSTLGTTVARFGPTPGGSGISGPAIVQHGGCVWSAVDLGAAFASLLSEHYCPDAPRGELLARQMRRLRRPAESAYYAAPDAVRRWIQRRAYAIAEERLHANEEVASAYPVDDSGWLLIELVKRLIVLAAGVCVRLERWPAPHRAAATLTHDLEPRRYTYTRGLDRLLRAVEASGHVPAFGLVARSSARYLTETFARRLKTQEVICHGLDHRGEPVHGRAQVASRMQVARAELEQQLRCVVRGYRSPRLDRSPDLAWALDQSGFRYDSSYPDVDRENVRHYGRGVRLNLPFRPIIEDEAGRAVFSRCLELPLTAPDCVQPLFAGEEIAMLRTAVETKAAFVRTSGGLYVALVHAGVFGDRDAEVRADHLAFVRYQLGHPDFWLAGIGQVAEWWCAREALRLCVYGREVSVTNAGSSAIVGVRLVVDRAEGEAVRQVVIPLPALVSGAAVTVRIPCSTHGPGAGSFPSSAPEVHAEPQAAGDPVRSSDAPAEDLSATRWR